MSQFLTVWRKELIELLGERHSRRGALVQAAVCFVALGIFAPWQKAAEWLAGGPMPAVVFLIFAPVLCGVLGADAFAGERERHTLETLFATPASPRAIVLGKAAAAVSFAFSVCVAALGAAIVTVNLTAHPPSWFVPGPIFLIIVLGGSLASASLVATLSIIISARVAVARSAQQMTSLLSLVLIGGLVTAWQELGLRLDLRTVVGAELAVLSLAGVGLVFAFDLFRPDRLFGDR